MSLERAAKIINLTDRLRNEEEIDQKVYLDAVLDQVELMRKKPHEFNEYQVRALFRIKEDIDYCIERDIPMKFYLYRKEGRIQMYKVM